MNRTIFKYLISPLGREFTLALPTGAEIVLVEPQRGNPSLWAMVDTDAPNEDRRFRIYGTGHLIPPGCEHVGSFQAPPFVWHLFEVKQ